MKKFTISEIYSVKLKTWLQLLPLTWNIIHKSEFLIVLGLWDCFETAFWDCWDFTFYICDLFRDDNEINDDIPTILYETSGNETDSDDECVYPIPRIKVSQHWNQQLKNLAFKFQFSFWKKKRFNEIM